MRIFVFTIAVFSIHAYAAPEKNTETLTLSAYLEQVKGTSPELKSSLLMIEGTEQTAKEGGLQYIPRLTFDGNITRDEQEYTNSLLGGKTRSNNMIFGLDQQFPFGLKATLTHNTLNNQTSNLTPLFFPNGENNYTLAQTQLLLRQSLWRNFFGRETRANSTLAEASALESHYHERFKLKRLVAETINTYYHLSIARESVKLLQELYDRSQKILSWNTRRVQRNLADRIDLLQSRASNQARLLELETGLTEQRSAELSFNALRNQNSSDVPETVTPITTNDILALKAPARSAVSDDIKAAEQHERFVVANNELSYQKAQPDLSVYSRIAYNGVDRYLSPALSESLSAKHPVYVLGVNVSFPIYFWETSEIRAGRVKQQLAAEAQTQQKKIEENRIYADLIQRFAEAKSRLKMADDLVSMNSDKLNYEKYRFNLGRTTTYQVLTFEQDYASAVIARLRIEQEILAIFAQLKTYAEGIEL